MKGILPNDEEELIEPPIEIVGVEVENNRDKIADVLDRNSLGVEVGDCSSLLQKEGLMQIGVVVVVGGVIGEVVLIIPVRGSASGGACQGVASAGGGALQSGGLGFLLSCGGAREGSIALSLPIGCA